MSNNDTTLKKKMKKKKTTKGRSSKPLPEGRNKGTTCVEKQRNGASQGDAKRVEAYQAHWNDVLWEGDERKKEKWKEMDRNG
ncbi:hypothetical protein M0804_008668 [Polistes exclamans]|nr:hypothetical protein M0804_008668 [Polistes exclamans]